MLSVSLQTTGVVDLRAILAKAGDGWPLVAERIAEDATETGKQAATNEIRAENLIATGGLLNDLKSEVRTSGGRGDVRVTGSVVTNLIQGVVTNQGRKAGEWAGRGLLRWVVLKFGDLGLLTKKGKARKFGKKDEGAGFAAATVAEQEARRLTFVISRWLKAHGTKERPWADKAGRAMQTALPAIADRCLDQYQKEVGF